MKYLDMAIVAITGFCFGWLLKYIQDEKAEYSILIEYVARDAKIGLIVIMPEL